MSPDDTTTVTLDQTDAYVSGDPDASAVAEAAGELIVKAGHPLHSCRLAHQGVPVADGVCVMGMPATDTSPTSALITWDTKRRDPWTGTRGRTELQDANSDLEDLFTRAGWSVEWNKPASTLTVIPLDSP